MSELRLEDFDAFFRGVHDYSPFPWQSMLVRRVAEEGWPEGIDLPTASGKTACLDIAVFALALTATPKSFEGGSPRRVFFVVDRRVVVDAAYERAQKLEAALRESSKPVVQRVAHALQSVSAGSKALIACRMRGGSARDLRWRLDPTQPAIITGTVDQVGSRLLFSGYGTSNRTASIDAALTACDSLILLDEAHCAIPFLQTARAVRRYSGRDWVREPVVPPLSVSVLSATLPGGVGEVFPRPEERTAALDAPELRRRIEAPKRARLQVAKAPSARVWTLGKARTKQPMVLAAAQSAADFLANGHQRIAVMVNRVRTAARIAEQLEAGLSAEAADVRLVTGRMRPVDRERLMETWLPVLRSRPKDETPRPDRPVIVVSTQCLEVGADFSFDALVTECAALDALRQRVGRLDRLGDLYFGRPEATPAMVLIQAADRKKPTAKQLREGDVDPVYGAALPATWKWLSEKSERKIFDFGISAVDQLLAEAPEEQESLLAPAPDAPIMLPAHLDLWVQTAPRPAVSPDAAVYLHGPGRGRPEARVVFRADLPTEDDLRLWRDTVALLPPTSAETLSLPLGVVKRWLRGASIARTDMSDVEGEVDTQQASPDRRRTVGFGPIRFLLWRGRDRTPVPESGKSVPVNAIRPDEVLVVRADAEVTGRLAHYFQKAEGGLLDVAEQAYLMGRKQRLLRLHQGVLGPWSDYTPVSRLLQWAQEETPDPADLSELLAELVEYAGDSNEPLPPWLIGAAQDYDAREWKLLPYPGSSGRGWLLLGRRGEAVPEDESFDDEDDTLSRSEYEISLRDHSRAVAATAVNYARLCLGDDPGEIYLKSGRLHDAGKADERFQALLQGSEFAVATGDEPLAKTPRTATQTRHRDRIRQAVGLPDRFRHEALSLQLVEQAASKAEEIDLLLHLIASHHGYARPFFPASPDADPPEILVSTNDEHLELTSSERSALIPPHRPDSGVAERFWRLLRRFGWWGLAYLESLLRLADWEASRTHVTEEDEEWRAA